MGSEESVDPEDEPTFERPDAVGRPGTDLDGWMDILTAMLPAPVSVDDTGAILGGDPSEVVIRFESGYISIFSFGIRWDSQNPVRNDVRVASYRLERAGIAQVSSAISGARAQRIGTYRWCALCRQTQPPEWMHDDSTCQGCAEQDLGVIY